MLVAAAEVRGDPDRGAAAIMAGFARWHAEHYRVARIVQYEFGHLTPAHRDAVLGCASRSTPSCGRARGGGRRPASSRSTTSRTTTLALMSMCVDVARWYTPGIRRTPDQIGATNARLGLRLAGARRSGSTD